jgi:hypothetical protein
MISLFIHFIIFCYICYNIYNKNYEIKGSHRLVALCVSVWGVGCMPERIEVEGFLDVGEVGRPDMGGGVEMGAGEKMGGVRPTGGGLSGVWLMVHSQSSCVLGAEQVATTDYLVRIEQQGSSLLERREVCAIALSPVLGTFVKVPAATRQSIQFIDLDRGFVTSTRVGGGYTSSTELSLWGVELDVPLTERLPTRADDERVVDADGDGHPGVSFDVGDGECLRYSTQRQIIRYHGRLTSASQIDGGSVGMTEATVLGATATLCRLAPTIEPNDEHSVFRMVRVDGVAGSVNADVNGDGEVSCEEVAGMAAGVLPQRAPESDRCR